MRRILLATIALSSLTSAAAVPALAAPARDRAKPCTKRDPKHPRKDRLCEGRRAGGALSSRFRLVSARVDGTITVRQGGDHTFTADGTSRYVVRATDRGTPFRIAAPVAVGGAGPVTWTASTTATWTNDVRREDCSRTADRSAAPSEFGGGFAPKADGRSVQVQWMLVNEGWACPTAIADTGLLPTQAQTSTYAVSRFSSKTVKLPIAIDYRWQPDDATEMRVTWKGSVTLRRVD
jgi:hypothetical protein